jgi:hypothetical protein
MNRIKCLFLGVVSSALLFGSCTKEVTLPNKADAQGKLLAGEKGAVKIWRLTGITGQSGTNPEQQLNLGTCFTDNRFYFKNNDAQDYEAIEGSTQCFSTDPALIEKGAWSFTANGAILLVLTGEVYSQNGLFNYTALDAPSTVQELTGTSLKLKMILNNGTGPVTYQISFVPA